MGLLGGVGHTGVGAIQGIGMEGWSECGERIIGRDGEGEKRLYGGWKGWGTEERVLEMGTV